MLADNLFAKVTRTRGAWCDVQWPVARMTTLTVRPRMCISVFSDRASLYRSS